MSSSRQQSSLANAVATFLAVVLVYTAAGKLGLALAATTKQVTAVWPPTGVAVAALLLAARARRGTVSVMWGIFGGALLVNATHEEPFAAAAVIAAGNTMAPVAAAFLLHRVLRFDARLARPRDVVGLVMLGALVPMTLSATLGAASLALAGIIGWDEFGGVWGLWWAGDAMGVVLFAPLLLTWGVDPLVRASRARIAEAVLTALGLIVLCRLVFTAPPEHQLHYAVFPLVLWVALRFGQRGTACAVAIVASIAVFEAAAGSGPFVLGPLDQRLLALEMFVAVVAIASLLLGAVTAERRSRERAHARARRGLEAELDRRGVELDERREEIATFVAAVTHDLREPMFEIQGAAVELEARCRDLGKKLENAALPSYVKKDIAAILAEGIPTTLRNAGASTARFERLADALLLLSPPGPCRPSCAVDMNAVIERTLDGLAPTILSAGVNVAVRGPLPAAIGDPVALERVFASLLESALGGSGADHPGQIEICGELRDGMACFSVRDGRLAPEGCAAAPEAAKDRGVALSILKRVVERSGGKVWAEPDDAGSTFHVALLEAPPPASA